MKYYSTQRPVTPGSYPKPEGNKVLNIVNFDGKTYCEELGREAWGYIDYERPLSEEEAKGWELTPGWRPSGFRSQSAPARTAEGFENYSDMACKHSEKIEEETA